MIVKSRIKNVKHYLNPRLESFRIVSPEINSYIRQKLHIGSYSEGSKFLPLGIGPVSSFNSDGSWKILKNQPKERRYVMTRLWTWKDWSKREHSRYVDIYRDCYPRKRIPAPSEELIFLNNKLYSDIISAKDTERIKHCINLFLELFGSCDFVNVDFEEPIHIKQKNFILLPSGENPFERLEHWKKLYPRKCEPISLIQERLEFFQKANPVLTIEGTGGYWGYIGFQYKNFLILDNMHYGNAIYVFPANAEDIISLSKKEVLDGNLHIARILHSTDWKIKIKQYLN